MKTYKYLFLSAVMALSSGFLASCDDDDDPTAQLPENFTVSQNATNVMWDETEVVVDFGANEKWSATSSATWAQIDPDKGEAGDHRLFLVLERNYNLMPRTAMIDLKCGGQTQQITVVQSGCDNADKVTTVDLPLETGTTDYASGELALTGYSYEIENNLGLTMAQFAQAVEDQTVELCIIDRKTGTWNRADYTANGLGYWLDSDLEITGWDGAGYPANALYIETYADTENGEVVAYIGRAPGITTEMTFELSFGYRLAADWSKYLRFNVKVTCPVYEPEITLVPEGNVINATVEMVDVYNATEVNYESFMEQLTDYLSVDSAEAFLTGLQNGDISFCMVDPETGEWLSGYTAGGYGGYWLGEDLRPTGWTGEYPSNTIYIETYEESFGIGAAPGVESGMEFNVSFVFAKSATKYIQFNLHAYEH